MPFILVLMIKNEEKILRRCLESVEGLVDAYCIADTGSTDTTCTIAREWLQTHKGSLDESTWKNFGFNRTRAYAKAREFAVEKNYDLETTYALLLDADMEFHVGTLATHPLGEKGYTIIQKNGVLAYPNTRLLRMSEEVICKGVTHEYWDVKSERIPADVCFIQDKGDGGCKADKFPRDVKLLMEGLKEDPTNGRYMFYLAQSYHGLGEFRDAIRWYQTRIDTGGWCEELWYSYYMIGDSYYQLKSMELFEAFMLKAFAFRPERAESVYRLAREFRILGQHYKAYQYCLLGRNIPLSTDSLFVEAHMYGDAFLYEETILKYYVGHSDGLDTTVRYLLKSSDKATNVHDNMSFYVKPLGTLRMFPVDSDACGPEYHPSSVSTCMVAANREYNIRYVNYKIDRKTGEYLCNGTIETQNIHRSGIRDVQKESVQTLSQNVQGLEDVRIYMNRGQMCFTATTYGVNNVPCIAHGIYHPGMPEYSNIVYLKSPKGEGHCEKNWLPIPDTDRMIYQWHPFQIGERKGDTLTIQTTHATPPVFSFFRGSAGPLRAKDSYWCLVHSVVYSTPRKYFHWIVKLDDQLKPTALSQPFVFEAVQIEYCIGMEVGMFNLDCIFSTWDSNPRVCSIPVKDFQWTTLT